MLNVLFRTLTSLHSEHKAKIWTLSYIFAYRKYVYLSYSHTYLS